MSRLTRRSSSEPSTITGALKSAIESSRLTDYALGKQAGVDPNVIRRFMTGERDIRGETLDRLAEALGLHLAERSRGRGRPARTAPEPPASAPNATVDED